MTHSLYVKGRGTLLVIIDREAREIIRLVTSVCPSVCLSFCLFTFGSVRPSVRKAGQHKLYVLPQLARTLCEKSGNKFVYFWNVCVFFAGARIFLEKTSEVKHTIYVGWPNLKGHSKWLCM